MKRIISRLSFPVLFSTAMVAVAFALPKAIDPISLFSRAMTLAPRQAFSPERLGPETAAKFSSRCGSSSDATKRGQ